MIYKGRGRRENLSDNRFIHCKSWLPRVVEGLVVEDGLKEALIAGSSMYQVGGQPGHRPEELVFVVKSLVARRLRSKQMVVLQSFDVQKFFDKEMMEDAIITSKKRGADAKAVRMWFKLNDETNIEVKTAVGMTKKANVGAVVGQGTMGGALVSQAVLDEAVMETFPLAGGANLNYGSVPMAPVMWVDDMLHAARGLDEARIAAEKVNKLMKQRNLLLNKEKSVCLIIGTPKQRTNADNEL